MKNILIIGASGFIGSNILKFLNEKKVFNITTLSRKKISLRNSNNFNKFYSDNFFIYKDWNKIMYNTDVVIIAAGAAHNKYKSIEDINKINYNLPKYIAMNAIRNDVKKIIFISSMSVHSFKDEITINENINPDPINHYGISKLKIENELIKICRNQLELTIIRPPLVYGNNSQGNFTTIQKFTSYKLYLPTRSINSKKSFIYIKNLAYFIYLCIITNNSGLFLISDDDDVSLTEIISIINEAKNQKNRQFNLNLRLMAFLSKIFFVYSIFEKIAQKKTIDISKAKKMTGYKPLYNIKEAINDIYNNIT